MFCLSAEPPFARSAGNEGKVSFRPGEWKGLSSQNSSVFRQRGTFLRERGIEDGIGRSAGLARRVARGEAEGRRRGGGGGEGAEGGKRGADAEEAVTLKGWMHMPKNVNILRIDDA